ncbi:hypothetical protein C5167_033596 [Papaver somniferum]|uniref:Protein kinase domain-containing protein n=1 Tax=Papaver somniferum TaxID=3469 RepID=A0A4Y7KC69_PAPSO|nr:hypothetical protein C5167_033596 [Papaver somniferum]
MGCVKIDDLLIMVQQWESVVQQWIDCLRHEPIANLLQIPSGVSQVIRKYTKQMLLGLEYLHKNGITHRDIKITMVVSSLLTLEQVVELATISGAKSMKGTPYWMAPEVILQTGHSFSADIWSFGCTMIEMATGKPPWSRQFQEVAALFHIGTTKSHPPIPEHLSITTCTREGMNKISLTGCDARIFCLWVRIAKRRTVQQVLKLIPKEMDGERFEDAHACVCRCIGGCNDAENANSDSDLEVVADSVTVNLRCPWQCPICIKNYTLEHMIIDPYSNRITAMVALHKDICLK